MSKPLLIVESPAKAKTIEKFLGKKVKVLASMGHVRDLPKSQFGVDVENNYEPKYITIRGKGKVLKQLRKEAKKAGEVYLATDPDREGEAISWHLAKALKLDGEEPLRVTFREITRDAVEEAMDHPRPIDLHLVDAQQARRVLDRLVGYRLSPLLWKKVRRGLSAGRVQSVAVRLIVDREREIEAFEPEEYWTIDASFQDGEEQSSPFAAKYYGRVTDDKQRELASEDEVQAILQDIGAGTEPELPLAGFTVNSVQRSERRRYPAPSYTTSALQQDASRKLGFSVRKTMSIAQRLYEGVDVPGEGTIGLITYIRTDSTRVSNQAVGQAASFVKEKYGDAFSQPRSRGRKDQEGAQDAHEAIRPSRVRLTPASLKGHLKRDEWRLYQRIWTRFVASQMAPVVYDTMSIDIDKGGHRFRASGSVVKFPGFTALYNDDEKADEILPELEEGQSLSLASIDPQQHFTKPPARYNEASLVKTMEELGIGRPSTYAPTIDTIERRRYVQREGKSFKPTDLGIIVTDLLKEHFNSIVDVEFTAEMEQDLDRIEEGQRPWREVVDSFYDPFSENLERAETEIDRVELPVEETDVECEKCGRKMVVKHGRYGKFLACPGFPDCKNTKPYLERTGAKCPECGGDIVQRRTKKGRTFYGCSNYPECEFATWNEPTSELCPECDTFLVRKKPRGKPEQLRCANKECGYAREAAD